jgi:hypothetical protein
MKKHEHDEIGLDIANWLLQFHVARLAMIGCIGVTVWQYLANGLPGAIFGGGLIWACRMAMPRTSERFDKYTGRDKE